MAPTRTTVLASPTTGTLTGKKKNTSSSSKKKTAPSASPSGGDENSTAKNNASASEHGNTVGNLSIKDISRDTGIKMEDIISTLQYLDMIRCWKGQHVVYVQQKQIIQYLKKHRVKKLRLCKPEYLEWEPPSSLTSSIARASSSYESSSKNKKKKMN